MPSGLDLTIMVTSKDTGMDLDFFLVGAQKEKWNLKGGGSFFTLKFTYHMIFSNCI